MRLGEAYGRLDGGMPKLATVIYLGSQAPEGAGGCGGADAPAGAKPDVCVCGGGDGAKSGICVYDGKGGAGNEKLKTIIYNECERRMGAPFALFYEGAGIFACGRSVSGALEIASKICGLCGIEYTGAHIITGSSGSCQDEVGCDANNPCPGRLKGKIALITGGAQGFGRGIAEGLAAEGAYIVVADINREGAARCAGDIAKEYGAGHAIAIGANVADEASVAAMAAEATLAYGGIDLFISNAGILIAGALPEMTKAQFELVTSVNYTGYFLGAKYASAPMKAQHGACPAYTADIIEINSKSGLEGSNKNFAYAGSKFGGIGLTQSFALELVEHGIKVNAICPGNFLDGPLWSDPVKGLFKQYLDAGKVPGAKTTSDVRRYYESRVPMKRGCTVGDVVKAILYLVDQQYETGQALPVTGGQVMLS